MRERERKSQTDITTFHTLPKNIDILTYSFPCQDISQQGLQKGLNNTRSGLLYEIEKILKNNLDRLPKVLVLENVKALLSQKFKNEFLKWIKILENFGYKSEYKIINSIDYGSSQNRERVFCISWLEHNKTFKFPKFLERKSNLSKILKNFSEKDDCSYLLEKYKFAPMNKNNNIIKTKLENYTKFNSEAYIYSPLGFGPTLTASGANSRLKFYFEEKNKLYYINAQQAFQYMGFTIDDYEKIKNSNLLSNSKMIYLCGNSISVEVLENIFKEIIKCKLV